jgi:hypothetical protein
MPETLSKVRVAKLKQPLASLVGIFATWATWFDSLDSHRGESLCQRHNFLKASNVIVRPAAIAGVTLSVL